MKKNICLSALVIALAIFITACDNPASNNPASNDPAPGNPTSAPTASPIGIWKLISRTDSNGTAFMPRDLCENYGSTTDSNGNGLMEEDMDGDQIADENTQEEYYNITETSLATYYLGTLTNIVDNSTTIDCSYNSDNTETVTSITDTIITTDLLTYNYTISGDTATITVSLPTGDIVLLLERAGHSDIAGAVDVAEDVPVYINLLPDTPYNGTLQAGFDEYFTFTANVSGTYNIDLTGLAVDMSCGVYEENGPLFLMIDDHYDATDETGTIDLVTDTTYQIIISNMDDSTSGDFNLLVSSP